MTTSAEKAPLPSRVYNFDDLPVRVNGENKSRAVLEGYTAKGYGLETHITELASGLMPHPPHQHAHAEMVILLEGTLEITISGKATTVSAPSMAYVAPEEHHGWKNTGKTRARYYIVTLGREPR